MINKTLILLLIVGLSSSTEFLYRNLDSNSQDFEIGNLDIEGNEAQIGGGIHNEGISPTIDEETVVFKDNVAE